MYWIDIVDYEQDADGDGIVDFNTTRKTIGKVPTLILSYPKETVGNGDILDFHVRSDEGARDEKVRINKRLICFFLHEATGYIKK